MLHYDVRNDVVEGTMLGFSGYCKLIHDMPAGKAERLQKVAVTIQNDAALTPWQQNLLLEQVFMKVEKHIAPPQTHKKGAVL